MRTFRTLKNYGTWLDKRNVADYINFKINNDTNENLIVGIIEPFKFEF